jgi:hypothetical protein
LLNLRFKMPISRERLRELDDRFRLCVCCHVRTATMAVGTLQALLLFFALASFSSHSIRPTEMYYSHFSTSTNSNSDPIFIVGPDPRNINSEPLKKSRDSDSLDSLVLLFGQLSGYSSDTFNDITPEHRHVMETHPKTHADELVLNNISEKDSKEPVARTAPVLAPSSPRRRFRAEDRFVMLCVLCMSLFFSLLLVIGATKRRPAYLIPFFCLQVFDFCTTCISFMGFFTYLNSPSVAAKQWLHSDEVHFPYKHRLQNMSDSNLMLLLVIVASLVITIKAYWLALVFSCYKYLVCLARLEAGLSLFDEPSGWPLGRVRSSRGGGSSMDAEPEVVVYEMDYPVPMEPAAPNSALPVPTTTAAGGVVPPKYDDVITKIPINANAPPPYFATSAAPRDATPSTR